MEKTFIFSRFNDLDKCQYPEKVPSELGAFVKKNLFINGLRLSSIKMEPV
ncbi:hypothetical protein [Candidatus Phytoplasma fraxini]|uniref:Uncharacterized protein n=1 Tax=Ash yellows phytoplasma TaxID=35780 RepID=A0ABZ2U878_ASHYP